MTALSSILYIEDDLDIQSLAKLALESVGGFTVHTANSGKDALKLLAGLTPQLILLDVIMPDMDGPETLAALRKLPGLGQTPVIFVTAKAQASEIETYKSLGAIGVIPKPFDVMSLAQQVTDLWNNHARNNG